MNISTLEGKNNTSTLNSSVGMNFPLTRKLMYTKGFYLMVGFNSFSKSDITVGFKSARENQL